MRANSLIPKFAVFGDCLNCVLDVLPAGMAVNQNAVTGSPSQQLVDGHIQGLALDVPERGIHSRDRAHGHGAAAPVRALIKVLPDVLDPPRIPPD